MKLTFAGIALLLWGLIHPVRLILLAALIGVPLCAQSWEDLRGLKSGDTVKVLDTAGRQEKGAFKAVSNDSISIETGKGEVAVDRPRVRRVQIRSSQRRILNTAIGAGIGVAIGAVIDQTLGTRLRNESGDGGRAVTYAVSIGGLAGIFAALPAYRTVYSVR
jgi:hypothetical protein